jgi:hypothetical protein
MSRRILDPPRSRDLAADPMAQWREAAKAVTRAWNAWLAAEPSERAGAHASYLDALAVEASAAARVADAA